MRSRISCGKQVKQIRKTLSFVNPFLKNEASCSSVAVEMNLFLVLCKVSL